MCNLLNRANENLVFLFFTCCKAPNTAGIIAGAIIAVLLIDPPHYCNHPVLLLPCPSPKEVREGNLQRDKVQAIKALWNIFLSTVLNMIS